MLKNKLVWSIDSVEARILTCSGQHVFSSWRGRARQLEAVGHWATFLGTRATEFVDPILGIRELSRIHKVQRRSPSKIAANVDLSIADLTMAWNGLDVVSTSCTGPVREQIGMGDQRDHRGWKLTMSPITRILQDGHWCSEIPFGKHTTNYGKSPFLMGKSSISMAIFNSKLLVFQRVPVTYHGDTMQNTATRDGSIFDDQCMVSCVCFYIHWDWSNWLILLLVTRIESWNSWFIVIASSNYRNAIEFFCAVTHAYAWNP